MEIDMQTEKMKCVTQVVKTRVAALSLLVLTSMTSLPVITVITTAGLVGVSGNAVAASDVFNQRKAYYKKAERLRNRADKARANGNDKKADKLDAKADEVIQSAPVIDPDCHNPGQGDCNNR
jgi:hypothetical protein